MNTSASPSVATGDPQHDQAWRPRFRVHTASVLVANLADGILLAAIPLIAIGLTTSPAAISMLQVVFWLPWLVCGIAAGVLIDRVDRNRARVVGMLLRSVVLLALTALAVSGRLSIGWLLVAVGLYGLTQVVIDLAGATMVPHLVPRPHWSMANGRVMAAEQLGNTFIGLPVGGFLVVAGVGWAFGVPVALGLVFVLMVTLGLRGGSFRAERPEASRPMQDVAEGLGFLVRHPVLRAFLVSGGVMNAANSGYFAIFVLWVVGPSSAVQLEPQHYPVLLAVLAVGALAGSVVAARLARRFAEVPVMLSVWGMNTVLLVVPIAFPAPAPIAAAFLGLGFTNMIGNVLGQTVRQRLVPSRLLGRTGGASRTVAFGLMPLGALAAGLLGEAFGLGFALSAMVVLSFVGLLYPLLTVRQRHVDALEVE